MASFPYSVDIDMNKNAILNGAIQSLASAPSTPVTGQIYYDTALGKLRIYSGSGWINCYETADRGPITLPAGAAEPSTTKVLTSASVSDHALTLNYLTVGKIFRLIAGLTDAPGATSWIKVAADGTVTLETAATTLTSLGAAPIASPTFTGTPLLTNTPAANDNSKKIADTEYVDAAIAASFGANDAMIFKGTIGAAGTITAAAFNALTTYNAGWAWKSIDAGQTLRGQVCEVGDMIIAIVDRTGSGNTNGDFTVVQNNFDASQYVTGPASAVDSDIAGFNSTTGKIIKSLGQLYTLLGPETIRATEKTTPVDADMTNISDSAASNVTKKLSWANIKATLLTYFSAIFTKKYSTTNGSLTSTGGVCTWTVTHSLNVTGVIVQVWRVSDLELIQCEVIATDANTCTIKFNSASTIGAGAYRVVVIG